ncbi:MAG TPA: hypothetical protein VNO33_16170, partial [Kofleriaceae bacterium]|nr:hypothetical protein [Kofleriaceae bacterium]
MARNFEFPDRTAGFEPSLRAAIEAEAEVQGGLSPELPGLVYERSLDRGERRAGAVYYTPPHLVDFTVERALG